MESGGDGDDKEGRDKCQCDSSAALTPLSLLTDRESHQVSQVTFSLTEHFQREDPNQ